MCMMVAIFPQRPVKKGMRAVAGTMTHDKAVEMQKLIDEELGKIKWANILNR